MPQAKSVKCCRQVSNGGTEQLIFETPAGQRITLQDSPPAVIVEDQVGNSVKLENGNVTVQAVGQVVLQASVVQVYASEVNLNAATVQCTGLLQAATVLAETVSAGTITQGGGNVW